MKHVLAAVLCKSHNCHPEAAESHAQASDSQRGISVPFVREHPTHLGRRRRERRPRLCDTIRTTVAPSSFGLDYH